MQSEQQREEMLLKQKRRLLALQNEPVTMFMTTRRGRSALLGDRTVTEGEFIEDGIRAAKIDRTGITFEIVLSSQDRTDVE